MISSNLAFNDGVIDETNSIRVDPMNIQQISEALSELYYNKEKRNLMSEFAKSSPSVISIEERARRIVEFLSRNMEK